jgi:hypothetical protein
MVGQIAHIIPTIGRPAVCQRLVDSIRERWPEANVYVCDDSREPHSYDGATDVPSGAYDIGLSAKRNRLVQATSEPLLMLWDDDYIAYEGTSLEPFRRVLEERSDIGIVGAEWAFGVGANRSSWFTGRAVPDGPIRRHRPPEGPPEVVETSGDPVRYHEVDFVPNWFLARRETLRATPWDEELKLQEHAEFFTRLAAARQKTARDKAWRRRYAARTSGEREAPAGDRVAVYCLATFVNERELDHLDQSKANRGDWVEVRPEYAEVLVEKGLAATLPEMQDTRPFPPPDRLPDVDVRDVPLGVALTPDTTCLHARDHEATEAYEEKRGRDKFWPLQRQKLGTVDEDLVQWSSYPHEAPEPPAATDEDFRLPSID